MKILQINVVYKKGSTGKIVCDIHKHLMKNGHDSIVCFGRGRREDNEENVYKCAPEIIMKIQSLRSKITGYAYSGCILSTLSIIRLIKREKPDVVHLHNMNGYFVNIYRLLNFLNENCVPTILTLHAEFMYTGGCGNALDCEKWLYGCGNCPQKGKGRPSSSIFDRSAEEWRLMKKTITRFDKLVVTSVSDWVAKRALRSPIMAGKDVITIENGLDTEVFKSCDSSDIKEKHKLNDEKIILHVTPDFSNPFKGGQAVIELAIRLLKTNTKIVIVGFKGNCKDLPKNIIVVEHTADQHELAKYYSMADITLLTSKSETFSMVTAESLACGTPVIGYKAGGPESIANEFSEFVSNGDLDALENSVRNWINKKKEQGDKISEISGYRYSHLRMFEKYAGIYTLLHKSEKGS